MFIAPMPMYALYSLLIMASLGMLLQYAYTHATVRMRSHLGVVFND